MTKGGVLRNYVREWRAWNGEKKASLAMIKALSEGREIDFQ
jgi:hypothetical protein